MKSPKLIKHDKEIFGLVSYKLDAYKDNRGLNFEIYDNVYNNNKIDYNFALESCSVSTKGVLRGAHGDLVNSKLIQCLFGEIQLWLIDIRPASKTFNKTKEFILNYKEPTQILIPPGVVNAHLCLSDYCVFYYKWSAGYIPIKDQLHVKWNDTRFNLSWKIKNPILSRRDE